MKINTDKQLKTIKGLPIFAEKDKPWTFALAVDYAITNDQKIIGLTNRMNAKKAIQKVISGGEQEFTAEEIELIKNSVGAESTPTILTWAVMEIIGE